MAKSSWLLLATLLCVGVGSCCARKSAQEWEGSLLKGIENAYMRHNTWVGDPFDEQPIGKPEWWSFFRAKIIEAVVFGADPNMRTGVFKGKFYPGGHTEVMVPERFHTYSLLGLALKMHDEELAVFLLEQGACATNPALDISITKPPPSPNYDDLQYGDRVVYPIDLAFNDIVAQELVKRGARLKPHLVNRVSEDDQYDSELLVFYLERGLPVEGAYDPADDDELHMRWGYNVVSANFTSLSHIVRHPVWTLRLLFSKKKCQTLREMHMAGDYEPGELYPISPQDYLRRWGDESKSPDAAKKKLAILCEYEEKQRRERRLIRATKQVSQWE